MAKWFFSKQLVVINERKMRKNLFRNDYFFTSFGRFFTTYNLD